MQDITDEIDRENKIITDLLTLVRLDKKAANVTIETVNINELLELILKRLKPIAAKKNIELILESFRPVTAEIDETKLTLAISNQVENGIKYNHENGWVRVSLNADHKYFYVTVAIREWVSRRIPSTISLRDSIGWTSPTLRRLTEPAWDWPLPEALF